LAWGQNEFADIVPVARLDIIIREGHAIAGITRDDYPRSDTEPVPASSDDDVLIVAGNVLSSPFH
jgi:hypothetical protein